MQKRGGIEIGNGWMCLLSRGIEEEVTDIAALMITNDTVAMDIAIALGESSSNILLGKRVSLK
jgi:hypothetical protein